MRLIKFLWTLGLLCPFVSSCTSNIGLEESVISEEDPISIILHHYIDGNSTRSGQKDLVITNVERTIYTIPSSNTRGNTTNNNVEEEYDVVRADFMMDGQKGYAYLTTHPEAEGVYYYTENGLIQDTIQNRALSILISAIPQAVGNNITNGIGIITPVNPNPEVEVGNGPLLKTQWNQSAPYNNYTPLCYCDKQSEAHHCLVGCTNIAVGQVIVYCKRFTGTYYGNKDIDFTLLESKPCIYSRDVENPAYNQVGLFLREVAVQNGSRFGCTATGANVKPAMNYLRDMGYTC